MALSCDILWNSLSLDQWSDRFARVKRSNVLQSYAYAQGASRYYRQRPRWGLIMINGKEAGLVQLMEARLLWGAIHGVILDRGPLWFDGYGGAIHLQAFLEQINKQFPKRIGRKRRLLLEIEDSPSAQALIAQLHIEKSDDQSPYETYWMDLTPENDILRANLKKKWRNSLNKAEKIEKEYGSQVLWDKKGAFYKELRANYALDKHIRSYGGVPPQFLDILAPFLLKQDSMLIGKYSDAKGDALAYMMFVKHGRSATYQIGWIGDKGRQSHAHHLLLWQGINVLKEWGVRELDLGGINDQTAAGIKKFKEGMGGEPYRLVGHYI